MGAADPVYFYDRSSRVPTLTALEEILAATRIAAFVKRETTAPRSRRMRTVAVLVFAAFGAASCGPKATPSSAVRPAAVHDALMRIEDPLDGVSRIRVAVRLVRSGEGTAKAEWSGWLPLDGKAVVATDTDEQGLGELQMVVEMIRARALVGDVLSARPYRWAWEGAMVRGTVDGGGYVSVRFDDRQRISFVRTNAPGRPAALDLRYDAKTSWVSEIDVHEDGMDLGMRWTRRDGGLFDLDVGAEAGGAAGEIHVRVLELEKAPKAP